MAYAEMKNESAREIARKCTFEEIIAGLRKAQEELAGHEREWSGMIGTEWEVAERNERRAMLRKLLKAYRRKAADVFASIAA